MNVKEIINYSNKPPIYTPGTSFMWTDPYISSRLLEIHLDKEVDLASRKAQTIEKTIDWVLSQTNKEHIDILDLGCGPGLYTEKLARKGHRVTGVDISASSIKYASESASAAGLDIKYYNQNYLELDIPGKEFDLVLMIYTDFGVLSPEQRNTLLEKIKKTLKSGGLFIFDVMGDIDIEEKLSHPSWECGQQGFWKASPYLALSSSFLYQNEKVILNQHIVVDDKGKSDIYRFWIHFFSVRDLSSILSGCGFRPLSFHDDVLPAENQWTGKNVTFCIAEKV